MLLGGCAAPGGSFTIADQGLGNKRFFRDTFTEAFYDVDGLGNVDIVLRREQPSLTNHGQWLTQVIHLQTLWRSIPGTTIAERTQVNGTVTYAILVGTSGTTFDGAGSLFVQGVSRDILEGSLEDSLLKPRRCLTDEDPLFDHPALSGEFRATRNRREVVRMVNDLDRRFGPLPPPITHITPE